jgi:hypothetical protein
MGTPRTLRGMANHVFGDRGIASGHCIQHLVETDFGLVVAMFACGDEVLRLDERVRIDKNDVRFLGAWFKELELIVPSFSVFIQLDKGCLDDGTSTPGTFCRRAQEIFDRTARSQNLSEKRLEWM